MKNVIWFEEPLVPPPSRVEEIAEGLALLEPGRLAQEKGFDLATLEKASTKRIRQIAERFAREKAQGVLRVHRPGAYALNEGETVQFPGSSAPSLATKIAQGQLYLVALSMELDVLQEGLEAGWSYAAAWCRTVFRAPGSEVPPRVLDIYPHRLYEGQPAQVEVEVGPAFETGAISGKIASAGASWRMGQVTPVTLGFLGTEQRQPYWEMREKETPIRGLYNFWLLVEQPPGCGPISFNMFGEGDLRTKLFTIPVGPRVRKWAERRKERGDIALESLLA